MRVGLIGFGYWGKILYSKLENLEVDIKFISNSKLPYKDKLKDVDWVIISTPNQTHYEIVKDCLLAGVNVFCEKSLTLDYESSLELYEIAEKTNRKLYVDDVFMYRENKIQEIKKSIGNKKEIDVIWTKNSRSDYGEFVMSNLYNLAWHDFYLVYHIFGNKIYDIQKIETEKKLKFSFKIDDIKINFTYDRMCSETNHSINGVGLAHDGDDSDALTQMLSEVISEKVDFKTNKQHSLFSAKTIDKLRETLFKRVAVVGGGIFGCTTAWMLSKNGFFVDLYEKNSDIMNQASNINQYRLHRGYHYPRSKDTALSSINSENSFLKEYGGAVVNGDVEHYYCIAKDDSKVDAKQYWTFLNEMNLHYKEKKLDFMRESVVNLVVKVKEFLFNPTHLKRLCKNKLGKYLVRLNLNSNTTIEDLENYDYIVNSTYANSNQLLSTDKQKDYQFELCEKPVIKLPEQYKNKSVVIMDGPFMCIDPLGDTGLHVMGNVVHAIHSTNVGKFPKYNSKFDNLLNKGIIKNPSITNIDKFIESAKRFFIDIDKSEHIGSMFTFRTVLPNRDNDDARPTLVEKVTDNLFNVFSGKIGNCVNASKKIVKELKDEK